MSSGLATVGAFLGHTHGQISKRSVGLGDFSAEFSRDYGAVSSPKFGNNADRLERRRPTDAVDQTSSSFDDQPVVLPRRPPSLPAGQAVGRVMSSRRRTDEVRAAELPT